MPTHASELQQRRGRGLRPAPMLLLCALAACAGLGSSGGRGTAAPSRVVVADAVAALQVAEAAFDDGRYDAAATLADSLFRAWRSDPAVASLADRALLLVARSHEETGEMGRAAASYEALLDRAPDGPVREEALDRVRPILARTGRVGEAVDLALRNPGQLEGEALDDLRQWVASLSPTQLRSFADRHPPVTAEARIVHLGLAQLLAAEGDLGGAREIAVSVLAEGPGEPELSVARLLASAGDDDAIPAAVVGAILPLTGELSAVGELLREGIDLALADRTGSAVELRVLDDGSDPERAPELISQLERDGVIAVIGPLRSESFAAAARARRNPRLALISPTAAETMGRAPNAYSLNDQRQLERDVAVDLGRWAAAELGVREAGILRPGAGVGREVANAFERAFVGEGGRIVARATFDETATTFEEPVRALAAAEPDLVFVPVASGRTVLTLGPQIVYYGLDRSIVLGNSPWAEPAVLRQLASFAADHRAVGMWVDRATPGTPWQRFVTRYEREYRKPLRDNLLPGLAHDAMALVLAALDEAGLPLPAAVAARLGDDLDVRGVTGRLRPDPETSTVRRETQIRMILDGRLRPVDRSELLGWLEERKAAPRDTVPFR